MHAFTHEMQPERRYASVIGGRSEERSFHPMGWWTKTTPVLRPRPDRTYVAGAMQLKILSLLEHVDHRPAPKNPLIHAETTHTLQKKVHSRALIATAVA